MVDVLSRIKQSSPLYWLFGTLVVLLLGNGLLTLWWLNQPVSLPTLKEPIPILNEDAKIAIGEPIVMELVIDKPANVEVERTQRAILCESGNLVTLTDSDRDVPAGQFRIIADNVDLPAKVDVGDICRFRYLNTYRINPIRTDEVEWFSEWFEVVAPDGGLGRSRGG